MNSRHPCNAVVAGSLVVWLISGCSRYPPAPEKPDINPREAGSAAVAQYDANHDGKLDETELKKCQALWQARKRIDGDGDAALTAEEITARINYWLHCGTTVMSGVTLITLDGRPLPGATVTLEPEEFLGPGFTACQGVTDQSGRASIKGPDPKYPGIYLGLYRVKVSKPVGGRETIPARYNTQTELGLEATDDIPGVGNIEFHLKRK